MPTDEELRARSKKRYQASLQATAKRRALVGYTCLLLLFCVSFYVAFHSEMMTGAETYSQISKVHNTQNPSFDQFWLWKAGGTMYNKMYCWFNASACRNDHIQSTPLGTAPSPGPKATAPDAARPAPSQSTNTDAPPPSSPAPSESTNTDAPPPPPPPQPEEEPPTAHNDEETDSPYTVLRVLGDVAVFAVSFVGYGCYFFATQG